MHCSEGGSVSWYTVQCVTKIWGGSGASDSVGLTLTFDLDLTVLSQILTSVKQLMVLIIQTRFLAVDPDLTPLTFDPWSMSTAIRFVFICFR